MKVAILSHSLYGVRNINKAVGSLPFCDLFLVLCPFKKTFEISQWVNLLRSIFLSRNAILFWSLLIKGKVIILKRSLNHSSSIEKLKKLDFEVGLHKTAVIYRQNVINCFSTLR